MTEKRANIVKTVPKYQTKKVPIRVQLIQQENPSLTVILILVEVGKVLHNLLRLNILEPNQHGRQQNIIGLEAT